MKLPIAVQAALDESERSFSELLNRMGLSRAELSRLAERIPANLKPAGQAAHRPVVATRRVFHV